MYPYIPPIRSISKMNPSDVLSVASLDNDNDVPTQAVDFGPPFDNVDADIIVRSSDHADFRVYKLFLVKASPILEDALSPSLATQPIADCAVRQSIRLEEKDGIVVICLPERRDVLSTLLSVIFSILSLDKFSIPDTLEGIVPVLATAQRYQMISILAHLRRLRRTVSDNPFRAYCLAWQWDLKEEALAAVHLSLDRPLTVEGLGQDLRLFTGPSLDDFLICRSKCADATSEGLRRFRESWPQQWATISGIQPSGPSANTPRAGRRNGRRGAAHNHGIPRWLDRFLSSGEAGVPTLDQMEFHYAFKTHANGTCDDRPCGCLHISAKCAEGIWIAIKEAVYSALQEVQNTLAFSKDETSPQPLIRADVTPRPVQSARSPFNEEDADIILRSSDYVDFRVYKATLSTSSPFFRDMFHLPQITPADDAESGPTDQNRHEVPVIPVSEDSITLGRLLDILIHAPPISDPLALDGAIDLLSASQKYQMDGASRVIRGLLSGQTLPSPLINSSNAYHAYALASLRSLPQEALQAARCALEIPLTFEGIGSDIRLLSGNALYELSRYRTQCHLVVKGAVGDIATAYEGSGWSREHSHHDDYYGTRTSACTSGMAHIKNRTSTPLPAWLAAQFDTIIDGLESGNLPPSAKTIADLRSFRSALKSHITDTNCANCARAYAEEGDDLWITFAENINEAIGEITLSSPWSW